MLDDHVVLLEEGVHPGGARARVFRAPLQLVLLAGGSHVFALRGAAERGLVRRLRFMGVVVSCCSFEGNSAVVVVRQVSRT